MFAVVFAFLCSLIVVNRAGAQGCVPKAYYSNYSSQSFDDSNFNLSQTVTTDGYASMDTEYCPGARTARHTPYIINKLTAPNGTVYGGTSSGPSSCVNCYISAQSTVSAAGAPGDTFTLDIEGWVFCSIAGTFWSVRNSGSSRFIEAYYKCTNWDGGQCAVDASGLHPYARCNPQQDFCDTVLLGKSPVVSRDWPQFGLFNALFISLPDVDICYVGQHGIRADMCHSPDPAA
jgi:hypothetical protein